MRVVHGYLYCSRSSSCAIRALERRWHCWMKPRCTDYVQLSMVCVVEMVTLVGIRSKVSTVTLNERPCLNMHLVLAYVPLSCSTSRRHECEFVALCCLVEVAWMLLEMDKRVSSTCL